MVDAAKLVELSQASSEPVVEELTMMAGALAVAPSVSDAEDIEKALLAELRAILLIPVAAEGAAFTKPADGSSWAAVFFMPESTRVATLGLGGQDSHIGLLQIDVNCPKLKGTAEAAQLVSELRYAFRLGRVLSYNATQVRVTGFRGPRSREVDGYYRRSLTVSWEAHVDRPT